MLLNAVNSRAKSQDNNRGLTLSDYYPKGTVYFYSFPAGEDSAFYNQVPTFDEELVSARPLVCAGDGIKVITFAASSDDYILSILSESIDLVDEGSIITLPRTISANVTGHERNRLVKKALSELLDDRKLVMAQPFLDSALSKKFRIKPELSIALSDKNNKRFFIPKRFLPEEYAMFSSGDKFYHDPKVLPCLVWSRWCPPVLAMVL